jgi:hypothetical protein
LSVSRETSLGARLVCAFHVEHEVNTPRTNKILAPDRSTWNGSKRNIMTKQTCERVPRGTYFLV